MAPAAPGLAGPWLAHRGTSSRGAHPECSVSSIRPWRGRRASPPRSPPARDVVVLLQAFVGHRDPDTAVVALIDGDLGCAERHAEADVVRRRTRPQLDGLPTEEIDASFVVQQQRAQCRAVDGHRRGLARREGAVGTLVGQASTGDPLPSHGDGLGPPTVHVLPGGQPLGDGAVAIDVAGSLVDAVAPLVPAVAGRVTDGGVAGFWRTARTTRARRPVQTRSVRPAGR